MANLKTELYKGRKKMRLPDILTREEQQLLLAVPNKNCPTGLRNHTMLTLFLNQGLRVSEALNLKAADIEWVSGRLVVRDGKGGKDRVLWLSTADREAIEKLLPVRPVQSDYVFCTLQGKKMCDRYVRDFVKRCAARAGIEKDVYPHLLRHTFATDMLNKTSNIRLVQKALGHTSIATTSIYTHIVDDQLQSALQDLRS